MLRVGSVVINVSDVPRAAAFWCAALGYEPLRDVTDDWVLLAPRDNAGPRLGINLSDQDPPEIPHIHLDLYTADAEDQLAEVERLVALGAERVDWPLYPEGEEYDYVVLADPDGNRFCVIDGGYHDLP